MNEGVVIGSTNGSANGLGTLQVVSCRPVGGCICHIMSVGTGGTLFQVAVNVLSICSHMRQAGPMRRPIGPFTIVPASGP